MDRNTLALAFAQILLTEAVHRNTIVTQPVVKGAIDDAFTAADHFVDKANEPYGGIAPISVQPGPAIIANNGVQATAMQVEDAMDKPEAFVFPREQVPTPAPQAALRSYDENDWVSSLNGRLAMSGEVNDANIHEGIVQTAAEFHGNHPSAVWTPGVGFTGVERVASGNSKMGVIRDVLD